jgi:hypothetical protein
MGERMTNLTDREREAVVNYFFESETAYLVELIFEYMPEDMLKAMGVRLLQDAESDDACD